MAGHRRTTPSRIASSPIPRTSRRPAPAPAALEVGPSAHGLELDERPSPSTSSRWMRTPSHSSSRAASRPRLDPVGLRERRARPPARARERAVALEAGRGLVGALVGDQVRLARLLLAQLQPALAARRSTCRAARSPVVGAGAPCAPASGRLQVDALSSTLRRGASLTAQAIAARGCPPCQIVDHPLVARHLRCCAIKHIALAGFRGACARPRCCCLRGAARLLRYARIGDRARRWSGRGAPGWPTTSFVIAILAPASAWSRASSRGARGVATPVGHLGMYRDEEELSPIASTVGSPTTARRPRSCSSINDARAGGSAAGACGCSRSAEPGGCASSASSPRPRGSGGPRRPGADLLRRGRPTARRARHPPRPRRRRRPPLTGRISRGAGGWRAPAPWKERRPRGAASGRRASRPGWDRRAAAEPRGCRRRGPRSGAAPPGQ